MAGALLHDVVSSFTPDANAGALFDVGGPGTEPTTIANLVSAGLDFNYPGSFPYLSDPWDGYDNPSVQNIAVRGNP